MEYSSEEIKEAINFALSYKGGEEYDKQIFVLMSYLYKLQDEVMELTYKYNSLIDELEKHGMLE